MDYLEISNALSNTESFLWVSAVLSGHTNFDKIGTIYSPEFY